MEALSIDSKKENENTVIGDTLQKSYQVDDKEVQSTDKCVGALLGVMLGDVLGAGVEGFTALQIMREYPNGVRDFISAPHMGIEWRGSRYGYYTDDTFTTLALALSLTEVGGLDPLHAARSYATFTNIGVERGFPRTAQAVLRAVAKGTSILKTGTMSFPDGSFANGGAMRITPIGISFRNATDDQLHEAVRMAIISSHVHPHAIDGAFLQAKAVSMLLKQNSQDFEPFAFLKELEKVARTNELKSKMTVLEELLRQVHEDDTIQDISLGRKLSSSGFQLKAVDAIPTALWGFLRYYKNPEECLIKTVGLGGDTDTVASMTGAYLGAMYGTSWIPHRWYDDLENDPENGRDFCVKMGQKLALLDLKEVLPFDESVPPKEKLVIPRYIDQM